MVLKGRFLGLGFFALCIVLSPQVFASTAQVAWAAGSSMVVRSADGIVRSISNPHAWQTAAAAAGSASGDAAVVSTRAIGLAGAKEAIFTSTRKVTAAGIARAMVPVARIAGPVAIGLTVVDLTNMAWDATSGWRTQTLPPNYAESSSSLILSTACSLLPPGGYGWNPNERTEWYLMRWYSNSTVPASWTFRSNCATPTGYVILSRSQMTPPVGALIMSTDEEIFNLINSTLVAKNSGKTMLDILSDNKINVDAGPEQITGPSTIPGPVTKTISDSPSGQTVTTNTTNYNTTYEGDTVNISKVVTTSVTKPDGSTATETVTDEPTDNQDDLGSVTDSNMPELPILYETKYPDGLAGVWNENKPKIETTEFYQGVSSMFPSFGAGVCPMFSIPPVVLVAFGSYGGGIFDVPCWIFQAIGLILLTTAAFTARKIIF